LTEKISGRKYYEDVGVDEEIILKWSVVECGLDSNVPGYGSI
jgi:hypothetical protein